MKLGILGTGMIVKDLLTTIDELGIESISILGTENTKEETEALKDKYNLENTFYDYDELLNSDVDTIYVALPNYLHYSFSKKALENNKHVIIEKPMTSNSKELEELINIADKKQLMIFEAMNIHYLPAFQSLKENINKIGKLKIVNFNYSQYSSRYNAFKEGIILPAFDYKKSGGALYDINVYNVNAIIGLFGVPQAVKYNANIEKNIDTSGIMNYDYTSFKAISIGAKDCKAPIISTLQGDNGVILIETPINIIQKYKVLYNDGKEEVFDFSEDKHRLSYEFIEFKRMIEEKDYTKQKEMLDLSLEISRVMEKARKEEGIIFTNDK